MRPTADVNKIADKINALGLTAPAILLLEIHKPLTFIGNQLLLVAQPTLNLFFSGRAIQAWLDFLEGPAQLEQLIAILEEQASHPSPTHHPAPNGHLQSEEGKL